MRTPLLLTILCAGHLAFGQFTVTLDENYIKATFSANGLLFMNPTSFMPEYIVPGHTPGSATNATIFAAGIWMGGLDAANEVHVSASTYHQTGDDFMAGPLATDYTSEGYLDTYERVWLVTKEAIDTHIAEWTTGGYVVPSAIASWPGNGNTANGEAAILAPFYDYNNNSLYDPADGDYPIIRGDEAAFMIINDMAGDHGESTGEPFGMELHIMAYAFDAPTDSALNQTVFMNLKVINRSANDYHDFFMGTFSDFDLGCYEDDYVGCDSTLNLFFAYNADPEDGPFSPDYGNLVPAQGIAYLNRPMHMFRYYNNDFSVTGNPVFDEDYFNYLQGNWIDGTPQTEGGNGYGGVVPNNFMFSGHPMDPDAWTEINESNPFGDRRGLGSIRPVSINAGDTMCLDMAFISAFAFDTVYASGTFTTIPALGATEILKQRSQDILDFYNANYEACMVAYANNPDFESGVEQEVLLGLQLSPNPAKDFVIVRTGNLQITDIQVVDMGGKRIDVDIEDISGPELQIDVNALSSGLYLVRCLTNDGTHLTATFIRQ